MMKTGKKGNVPCFLIFFGLGLAFSGCAILPPSESVENLAAKIARLEKEMQEISAQVEKNRDSLLVQEASIREYQIRIGSSEAEKVTPEPPKTGLDRQQTSFGRDITPAAVYRGAFGNYASGRYQQAILGFNAFLERYPDNPYTANARFWIGECHYVLDEYPQALEAFEAVVNSRTSSDKAPDALLRMVSILKKLQSDQRAQETADFLVKNYPDSLAARTLREYYPEYKAP